MFLDVQQNMHINCILNYIAFYCTLQELFSHSMYFICLYYFGFPLSLSNFLMFLNRHCPKAERFRDYRIKAFYIGSYPSKVVRNRATKNVSKAFEQHLESFLSKCCLLVTVPLLTRFPLYLQPPSALAL